MGIMQVPTLKITQAREALGITRAECARRAGINASTQSQLELGRFKGYPSQLSRLAAILRFEGDPADLVEPADEDQTR